MRYRELIESIPPVSEIGLGAWQLGVDSGWKNLNEKEAIKMVHKSLDLGINFFDTAPNYGLGTSEIRLGKALKGTDRTSIIINTKFGHSASGITDYSSNQIRESLEGSLKRLQLEYVDSLIIHNPPIHLLDGNENDHFHILEDLKKEGKIKAYGASIDTYDEMKLLMDTTNSEVIEAFFNILHQDSARAFETAAKKKVGIIAKIPFDSGWLTGKYNESSVFEGVRRRWSKTDIATRAQLVKRINQLIEPQINISQTALQFCLAYDAVSTVIPGSISTTQLEENVNSLTSTLSNELRERLEIFYQNEVKDLNLPW